MTNPQENNALHIRRQNRESNSKNFLLGILFIYLFLNKRNKRLEQHSVEHIPLPRPNNLSVCRMVGKVLLKFLNENIDY